MITESILEFAEAVPPHQGKTATSAEKLGTFREVDGEIAGEVRLVKGWIGIGQKVYHCIYYSSLEQC
jgi:hypothetical protein